MQLNDKSIDIIEKVVNRGDFVFLDSPNNYFLKVEKENFWYDVSYVDLLMTLECKYVFIWTKLEFLPSILSAYQESDYELKGIIPHVSPQYGTIITSGSVSSFKYPIQYLVYLRKPKAPVLGGKVTDKVIIVEEVEKPLSKPVRYEDELIQEMHKKGLTGLYILPDGSIGICETKESSFVDKNCRKELF